MLVKKLIMLCTLWFCTVVLFLTIIGADYSKNTKCYKNEKIVTHKVYKNKGKVRVMSLFRIGLTFFIEP